MDYVVSETRPVVDPGRSGMLSLVGAILVLSMTTWFSATAVLADLRTTFRLSAAGAAWLTNAVQLGFVVAALALSISGLADSLSAKRLMVGAALLAALANLGLLAAPSAGWLLVSRFVTGLALAGVYPPAMKVIASWFASGRGLAMGAAVGALTLGSSGPYLVKAVGAAVDWHLVVAAASLAAVIGAVLALFVADGPHAGPRPRFDWRRIATVLRDPALMLANLGYFGHMWELYAMWGWFLVFTGAGAKAGLALPVSPALLTFLVIAIGAIGCLLGGFLADRIGRDLTAAGMMIASGLCAVSVGFVYAGPAALFVAVAIVWGIAVIGDSAQFSALVTELSEPATTGAALSLQIGIGYLLTLASIRLVPVIADRVGWQWSFVVLAPGPFVGAAAILTLRALVRRRARAHR